MKQYKFRCSTAEVDQEWAKNCLTLFSDAGTS
jgi:hypothetical protein